MLGHAGLKAAAQTTTVVVEDENLVGDSNLFSAAWDSGFVLWSILLKSFKEPFDWIAFSVDVRIENIRKEPEKLRPRAPAPAKVADIRS